MNPQVYDQIKCFSSCDDSLSSVCKTTPTGRVSRRYKSPEERNKGDPGRWTPEEHMRFLEGFRLHGRNWKEVADVVGTRSVIQIRTHAQKYLIKEKKAREVGHAGAVMMDGKGILSPMERLLRDTVKISKKALKEQESQIRKEQKRNNREFLKKHKQQKRNNRKKENNVNEVSLNAVLVNAPLPPSLIKNDLLATCNYGSFPTLCLPISGPTSNSVLNTDSPATLLSMAKANAFLFSKSTIVNVPASQKTNSKAKTKSEKKQTQKKGKEKFKKPSVKDDSASGETDNIATMLFKKEAQSLNSSLQFAPPGKSEELGLQAEGSLPKTLHSSISKSAVLSPLAQPTIARKLSMGDTISSNITTGSLNTSLGPACFSESSNSLSSLYSNVTKKLNYLDNSNTITLEVEAPEVKLLDIDFHQSFQDELKLTDIESLIR